MIAITVKYLGPTNTKGTRLKAYANGNSITISKNYALSDSDGPKYAAQVLCDKMKWKGHLIHGGTEKEDVFVFLKGDYKITQLLNRAASYIAKGLEKGAYKDTVGQNVTAEKTIHALEELLK